MDRHVPDLDHWLDRPTVRIRYVRETDAEPEALWAAARAVRTSETRRLGRLLRLRIPGLPGDLAYDELFREPPFTVLYEDDHALLAGIVGRIWTVRRDYPSLSHPDEFRHWSARGTVKVLFANWVEPAGDRTALVSETRVAAGDRLARLGVAAVRPLIVASQQLIANEGLERAVARSRR
ncbi:MAG TPA: hypothetical protein VG186_16090 [Solirubrobacteraceae bacterium]|jgi:hypothetical protein|nr:hypothetical protein [Solirubrobacteraceae bacterium]